MSHAAGHRPHAKIFSLETRNVQRVTCSFILFLLISLTGCAKESLAPTGSTTTTLPPPPQAGLVLGQTSFTKNGINLVDALGVFTPSSIAVDNANNRLYVADTENSRVLVYSNLSTLSSGAAANIVIGQTDLNSNLCNKGGPVGADTLCRPTGVAVDTSGNLYVADSENNRVLEYDAPITTGIAATRVFGQLDIFGNPDFNTNACDQNSSVSASTLCSPKGVTVDGSGNLYVADTGNNRVLEYDTPLTIDTTADRVFGQGDQFTTNDCNNPAPQVGNIGPKSLCAPQGIALDSSGNLYVADRDNHRVLEYNSPLTTDTIADVVLGQANMTSNRCNRPTVPNPTSVNPSNVSLCSPQGVAVDGSGNVFVADTLNHRVLRYAPPITTSKAASNVFGQTSFAVRNCGVTSSTLCGPVSVALDTSGDLYVADTSNSRVLKYTPPFNVPPTPNTAVLVLGQSAFTTNGVNFVDAAGLNTPKGVAVDSGGNLYVADTSNNRVLEYDNPLGTCPTCDTTADRFFGQADINSNLCNQGGAVSATTLCSPTGVAVDSTGNLYVADTGNNRVLEYTTPVTSISLPQAGAITASTVFGQTDMISNLCNQGGAVSNITLCGPQGVTVDGSDNLYVADTDNNRVLEFDTPLANSVADRVFGQGDLFDINDCNNTAAVVGGLGAKSLCFPEGIVLDSTGNLYVADTNNNRVLEYTTPVTSISLPQTVAIPASTVFGQPDFTSNGINANNPGTPSLPSDSSLFLPTAVAVDDITGDLYVADTRNNRVLEYDTPLTTDSIADGVFGQPDFMSNLCNNSAAAIGGLSDKSLCSPEGIVLDSATPVNHLYVTDTRNHRVLRFP